MATAITLAKKRIWPDEALEALPKNGSKYELLDNELIMSPVHANHRPDSIEALTRSADVLGGAEVVPGFKCRLSQIFHPR